MFLRTGAAVHRLSIDGLWITSLKLFVNFYTGTIKIAVFTTLAWIPTAVLIFILPKVAASILIAMMGATVTILPTASYIIMFIAVHYNNRKVQDMVSSQQLQGILRREKKVAMDMFIVSVVLAIFVIPKFVVTVVSQSFGSLYPSFYLWSTTSVLLNSSINPVLYIWRRRAIRFALRSLVNIWQHGQVNTKKQKNISKLSGTFTAASYLKVLFAHVRG